MKLIAVTDDKTPTKQLISTLLAIEPYINAVILREKTKTDCAIVALCKTLLSSGFDSTKLIVHGRADIATILDSQNVQLPSHGVPLSLVKECFPNILFGESVHSLTDAKIAANEGAAWLIYGHLFATNSKEGLRPRGTDELSQIINSVPVPVYAIGGITPARIRKLHDLHVAGVAVMSSIFGNNNPADAAKSYYDTIQSLKLGGTYHD